MDARNTKMNNFLNIQNLSAGYQKEKPILTDFSLQLEEGQRIGIVGKNGSGKSTLAKAIMGIAPYIKGTITLQGKDLTRLSTHQMQEQGIGYFMQGGRVFGNLSVAENIKFALLNQKEKNIDTTIEKLRELNITLFSKQRLQLPAANLSGGERHILGFLMVMYAQPNLKLLIADEPSAGIAKKVQLDLLQMIKFTLENKNVALLLIEQNIAFLEQLTNNIINISNN